MTMRSRSVGDRSLGFHRPSAGARTCAVMPPNCATSSSRTALWSRFGKRLPFRSNNGMKISTRYWLPILLLSREPFLSHHCPRVVERLVEARHHFVDLGLPDDQRRAERHDVARHAAQDQPVVLRAADQERSDGGLRIETLFGRLVADDLHRTDEADAARLADERMIREAADARLQTRPDPAHLREDVELLV